MKEVLLFMKRILSFTLIFIITLSVLSALSIITSLADNIVFEGGNGTEEFPYLISTPEQLKEVRNYPDSYFMQTADIDMTNIYYTTAETLNGGYDGGGHYIKGLTACMFDTNNGFIRSLGLVGSNINDSGHNSSVYPHGVEAKTAALVSANNGEISGCYSVDFSIRADVSYSYSTDVVTYAYAGGLVCANGNSGVIENCYSIGSIRSYASSRATGPINTHATAEARAGGITANNSGVIKNCYSVTDTYASADKSSYTGSATKYEGIVCAVNIGTIENSYYVRKEYSNSQGVGMSYGQEAITEVTDSEIKSYDMIRRIDNPYSYIYQQDIYNSNNGYPILNTQPNGTMGIVTSHKSGNYKGAFDLDIQLEFPNGGTYNLYYAVAGKNESFSPCLSPISITDKNTTIIAYVENAFNTKMRRIYKLDYRLADHPVSANHDTGQYAEPLSVILTSDEPGAEIYYTTDGSDPKNGIRYTGAIPVFKNTSILTIAKVNGEFGDAIEYEYKISPVITPSVPEGNYNAPFNLSLQSSLAPYEIYYTTNGWGDPTKEGEGAIKYTGEFEVYSSTNIKAAACFEGEWSQVYTFSYTFSPAEITASLEPGEYSDVQTVSFSCNLPYADLKVRNADTYELCPPTVEIYKTTTINVTAEYKGEYISQKSFTYTLPNAEITANPPSGSYSNIIQTELSVNIPSYDIYYTLDGSDPKTNGTLYSEPIELDKTTTIKTAAKYKDSTVLENSFDYTLNLPYVTAGYESGIYNGAIEVALSSSNSFYDIYYTTDGSDPKKSGIKYISPIKVLNSSIIRAVPVFNNIFGTSSSYKYLISSGELDVPYVTANYESGTYTKAIEVTLLSSSEFYDVYYTTDGKDPTIYGTRYTSPIKIKTSSLIKAAPVFNNNFGTVSSYEYHILAGDSPNISAHNFNITKTNNYLYVNFLINNNSLVTESSDLYIALYDKKGALLKVEKQSIEIQPSYQSFYAAPIDIIQEPPADGYFKIICWAKDTMYPLFASEKISVSEIS